MGSLGDGGKAMQDHDPALTLKRTLAMGRRVGVDLRAAVSEGWFTRKEMGGLLSACAACGQDALCLPWLSEHRFSDALPPFCRNKAAIEALSL